MDPLQAKIRAQLPSETLSFALIVRGEVLKEQLPAFTKLAHATEESTQKEPGNLLYRFFFSAQDPLEYVLLESWVNFPALAAHFETAHFKQFAQGTESLTGERFSVEVLLREPGSSGDSPIRTCNLQLLSFHPHDQHGLDEAQ